MRGAPLSMKCPACRRGMWNNPRPIKGVRPTGIIEEKPHRCGRRRGYVIRHRGQVRCLDCGHVWWSTHPDSGAKAPWQLRERS